MNETITQTPTVTPKPEKVSYFKGHNSVFLYRGGKNGLSFYSRKDNTWMKSGYLPNDNCVEGCLAEGIREFPRFKQITVKDARKSYPKAFTK